MKTILLKLVDYSKYVLFGKFIKNERVFVYNSDGQLISVIGR